MGCATLSDQQLDQPRYVGDDFGGEHCDSSLDEGRQQEEGQERGRGQRFRAHTGQNAGSGLAASKLEMEAIDRHLFEIEFELSRKHCRKDPIVKPRLVLLPSIDDHVPPESHHPVHVLVRPPIWHRPSNHDEMAAHVDSNPEGFISAKPTISVEIAFDQLSASINLLEQLQHVKLSYHLAHIADSDAKRCHLPVDHKKRCLDRAVDLLVRNENTRSNTVST
jgi:hypothetical protein